jgi:hypothetical protein
MRFNKILKEMEGFDRDDIMHDLRRIDHLVTGMEEEVREGERKRAAITFRESHYQLGIREKMAEAAKAKRAEREKSYESDRKQGGRAGSFRREIRESHLEALRQTCLDCVGEGNDLDLEAQAAIDVAVQLAKAIENCNSETKDAVCTVVADILMDEDSGIVRWCPGPLIRDGMGRLLTERTRLTKSGRLREELTTPPRNS